MAKKRIAWKIFLIAAVVLVIFLPGMSRYHQLKARQAKLERGIAKLRDNEVDLRKQQEKLQKDPTYIEKVAREKLQVVEKGETVVRIEGSDGR